MKKLLLFSALVFSFIAPSKAQMTLMHTLGANNYYDVQIVDLALSGKKIAIVCDSASGADTIYYYNLDYSLWKIIPCPYIPGYQGQFLFGPNDYADGYICYSSETLFNTDSLLEAAIEYAPASGSGNIYKWLVINENGTIMDSIMNGWGKFEVHAINSTTFIATVRTFVGVQIYSLPGTLPCDDCSSSSLGVVKTEEKTTNILSAPIPNPSKNQVKITFTLPEGATRGQLSIYSTAGQLMKTYTVDNRFGFIMVDDSQFAPGMYYYNLSVNGEVSSSQKMVVIK